MGATATCLCDNQGYVRALEEDAFGSPDKVDTLAELNDAILGQCRHCGAWWERLAHHVYGYAWYRTDRQVAPLGRGPGNSCVAGAEARAEFDPAGSFRSRPHLRWGRSGSGRERPR